MGFFKLIKEFFESIFNSDSPEVKKKQELRKVESELKMLNPVLYKNGMIQPNLAELLRIFYENTKPIADILSATTNSTDQKRAWRFKRELIITGFSNESKERLENLSYENRLEKALSSSYNIDTVLATQHKHLEDLIKDLNSRELISIDYVIANLDQLSDICNFNFLTAIRTFDPNYDNFVVDYKPNFVPIVPEAMETTFSDLYYLTSGFSISTSLASAVIAAAQMKKMTSLPQSEKESLLGNLKKINAILKKNLPSNILKNFAILAQKNPDIELKTATYKVETRQKFATFLEDQFHADENRLKSELKDRDIESELKTLFGGMPLLTLKGYNADTNHLLKTNSPSSFLMITPMQILKTFVVNFLTESTMTLLNNIIVEGFFNNSEYKTEFSQAVFAATETQENINAFEDSFGREKRNDQELISGYIQDSHKNPDFMKDLTKMVDTINVEAKNLIQKEANVIFNLTMKVQDIVSDTKKASPDTISNIKVLASSSRNRDAFDAMEKNFSVWKNFLNVIKNYVIIGDVEKK